MSWFGAPGPVEILIIGVVVVLLLSGRFGTSKWVYSVGRWVAAVQVHLGALHPRQVRVVVILCFCFLLGTLALALLLRG